METIKIKGLARLAAAIFAGLKHDAQELLAKEKHAHH